MAVTDLQNASDIGQQAPTGRPSSGSGGRTRIIIPGSTPSPLADGRYLVDYISIDQKPSHSSEELVVNQGTEIGIKVSYLNSDDKLSILANGHEYQLEKLHKDTTKNLITFRLRSSNIGQLSDNDILWLKLESSRGAAFSGTISYYLTYHKQTPEEEAEAKRKADAAKQAAEAAQERGKGPGVAALMMGATEGAVLGTVGALAGSGKPTAPTGKPVTGAPATSSQQNKPVEDQGADDDAHLAGADAEAVDEEQTFVPPPLLPEHFEQLGEYLDKNPGELPATQDRQAILKALKTQNLSGLSQEQKQVLVGLTRKMSIDLEGKTTLQQRTAAVRLREAVGEVEVQGQATTTGSVSSQGGLRTSSEIAMERSTRISASGQAQASGGGQVTAETKVSGQGQAQGSAGAKISGQAQTQTSASGQVSSEAKVSAQGQASASSQAQAGSSGKAQAELRQNFDIIGSYLEENKNAIQTAKPGLGRAKENEEKDAVLKALATGNVSTDVKADLESTLKFLSGGQPGQPLQVTIAATAALTALKQTEQKQPGIQNPEDATPQHEDKEGVKGPVATPPVIPEGPDQGQGAAAKGIDHPVIPNKEKQQEQAASEAGAQQTSTPGAKKPYQKPAAEKPIVVPPEIQAEIDRLRANKPIDGVTPHTGAPAATAQAEQAPGKKSAGEVGPQHSEGSTARQPVVQPAAGGPGAMGPQPEGEAPSGSASASQTPPPETEQPQSGPAEPGEEISKGPDGTPVAPSPEEAKPKNETTEPPSEETKEPSPEENPAVEPEESDLPAVPQPPQSGVKSFDTAEAEKAANQLVNSFLNTQIGIWVWGGAFPSLGMSIVAGMVVGDLIWLWKDAIIRKALNNPLFSKFTALGVDPKQLKIKFSLAVKAQILAMNAIVIGALLIVGIIIFSALWGICNSVIAYPITAASGLQSVCSSLNSTKLGQALSSVSTAVSGPSSISYTPPTGGSCNPVTAGVATPAQLALTCFSSVAVQASIVASKESGGNPAVPSGVDICRDANGNKVMLNGQPLAVSWGLFQINLTSHKVAGLNCPSAFSYPAGLKVNEYDANNRQCNVVGDSNVQMYNNCVAAAQDPQTNINLACQIYQAQGWGAWGTAAQACVAGSGS